MKSLITATVIALLSLSNNSSATGNSELINKIESINLEPGSMVLSEKPYADFVKVSFKVNDNGELDILELNYSNEGLKDLLVEKLKELKIPGENDINQIHNYRFSFKLI